ncbi:MAG: hypothetical protein R6W77_09535 [Trueperaceae bacterium]
MNAREHAEETEPRSPPGPTRATALPLALMGAGVLWLLVEVGFVPNGLTRALLLWWPLFLVAVGIDLLAPRARPWRVPFTYLAALAVLLLGVVGLGAPRPPETTTAHEVIPPGARTLHAIVDLGNAHGVITASNAFPVLLDGTFEGRPTPNVGTGGLNDIVVEVRPAAGAPSLARSAGTWRLALAATLPTALELRSEAGGAHVDLASFALETLSLDAGNGDVHLLLPGRGEGYEVRIDGGRGHVEIDVRTGASLDLVAELGAGGATLRVEPGSDVRALVATGLGDLILDLPQDAPIRLEVLEDGPGRVDVGNALLRRVGSGDTGIWQSLALERGGRVIDVRIVDVGAGSITVR